MYLQFYTVPNTCLVLRPKLSPIKRALKVNELKIVRMYIKFRYFEKNSKNNLTICFEDWKVNEKKRRLRILWSSYDI